MNEQSLKDLAYAAGVLAGTQEVQDRAGVLSDEANERLSQLAAGWAQAAREGLTEAEFSAEYDKGEDHATNGDLS